MRWKRKTEIDDGGRKQGERDGKGQTERERKRERDIPL